MITVFTFFIITNFKIARHLNNFQEHFCGILRPRKYPTSLQNFFPRANEAIKHELIEFKVQCLKIFCYRSNKSTILLFNSIFRTTPDVSSKLYSWGGGGGLPNKGRYGCAVSAKPSPGKISPQNLMPEQKVPKNLMTGQVFMTFRVPKLKIFSK